VNKKESHNEEQKKEKLQAVFELAEVVEGALRDARAAEEESEEIENLVRRALLHKMKELATT
jgi:hypothetical protein